MYALWFCWCSKIRQHLAKYYLWNYRFRLASLVAQTVKLCLHWGRPGFDPWVRKIPWRRKRQPTPILLPGKFHGWRSLVGFSPWDCKELDMTEQLPSLIHIDLGGKRDSQVLKLKLPFGGGRGKRYNWEGISEGLFS